MSNLDIESFNLDLDELKEKLLDLYDKVGVGEKKRIDVFLEDISDAQKIEPKKKVLIYDKFGRAA